MIRLIQNIILLAFVFGVGYIFGVKGVRFYEIVSGSMEPTLLVGDRIASVRADRIHRKDIVIVRDPEGSREMLTKRVVGLPGDRLEVKGGDVLIDGEVLPEPYRQELPVYLYEVDVPKGYYVLLGDNRNRSEDSHIWGPVPRAMIGGRGVMRYWPWKRIGIFITSRER
jgi:signal peptidase I